MPHKNHQQEQRSIRVFISSTFRDMQQEREILVKRTFPQLRAICETRQVAWSEVDLRWGITEEQKNEGRVLPICFEEIDNCRPYFICIIGQRYGWVPRRFPAHVLERHLWLRDHADRSATELEIRYAVLMHPELFRESLFYFRNPDFVETIPCEQRRDFVESPTEEEIAHLGPDEAQHLADIRMRRLSDLKQQIRRVCPNVRDYTDPLQLGDLVLRDIKTLIDSSYPEEHRPDPFQLETRDHESFVSQLSRTFIKREEYFRRLDDHLARGGPPLIVVGDTGLGKSAILANWLNAFRKREPGQFSLIHFTESSWSSANVLAMLRRIILELARFFELPRDLPDTLSPVAMRTAFADYLRMASAKGAVVIILDGLDKLEDTDFNRRLLWLPDPLPPKARLILSTTPSRLPPQVAVHGWPVLQVSPLERGERKQFIEKHLSAFSKTLVDAQLKKILTVEMTGNPLCLRAILEELRIHGDHYGVDKKIDHYLSSKSIKSLFSKILERLERDYNDDRHPTLVQDVMSTIAGSRGGLRELELLEIISDKEDTVPDVTWSPLYCATKHFFMHRSGMLAMSNDIISQAIEERYLASSPDREKNHLRIAAYFEAHDAGTRRVIELPWQLSRAAQWQRLYHLLSAPEYLSDAMEHNDLEVLRYWRQVEDQSDLRMVEAYRPVYQNPEQYESRDIWYLTALLKQSSHYHQASALFTYQRKMYLRCKDLVHLVSSVVEHAPLLIHEGRLPEAISQLQVVIKMLKENDDRRMQARALGYLALALRTAGRLEEAQETYQEEEKLCRDLGLMYDLTGCIDGQASIMEARGDPTSALDHYRKAERIAREIGNKHSLQISLGNQAIVLKAMGRWEEALDLHDQKAEICLQLGMQRSFAVSLGNKANIYSEQGQHDLAFDLYRQKERICRKIGAHKSLANCLGNMGNLLAIKERNEEARAAWKEGEELIREYGAPDELASILMNQAMFLANQMDDIDGAIRIARQAHRLANKHLLRGLLEKLNPAIDELLRQRDHKR